MARTPRSPLSASRLLAVVSVLLFILALLPTRAIRWVDALARPLTFVLGPVQGPLTRAAQWVSGGGRTEPGETPELAELRRRADEYRALWLNVQGENERLRRQIGELQKGFALNPEGMRQVYAPIIGGGIDLSPGLLRAKAGEREGVIVNSVAVIEGVQIVGKVTTTEYRYCLILPITQRAARGLQGVVMLDDDRPGPICRLVPTGTGVLNGRVGSDEDTSAVPLRKGMLVRLDDPEWPASSRMLVIGEIEEISTHPQQPTRRVISVRPRFKLDSISEVVIRVPTEADAVTPPSTERGSP